MTVAAARRVGRFELLRQLGRGAQATVWLAHDPRLQREVAIKMLDPQAAELQLWLHEARAVSRLQHPNVVPVFEADTVADQPLLVFEFVDGGTLAEARRGKGPMAAREAVTLMVGVLDALAAAHAQGIVHRDLKPSNLLLSADGRARVMDFGIAAHVAGGGDGRIAGTPGYMSPEAARGDPPAPQMDVFAAGMVLAELLAGAPLLRERDPYQAIHRVQHEDFALPPALQVDDGLRAIVARALARDPRQRYDAAASLRDALGAWLQPQEDAGDDAGGGHGTLEFLLRRMKHKRDFPALGQSVVRIQQVTNSETESLGSLASEVLKDVALTNKLLRMVNTVHFANAGAGSISTVSRAVALIGFAGIRNMALSVILLDHMQDREHMQQIREEFLRGLMAGTLASELCPSAREGEETFIAALFQNLGRMLAQYYFPEEAQRIRQDAKDGGMAAQDKAALAVLGLGYQALGVGIAKAWGLPEALQRSMLQPGGDLPAKGLDKGVERQRWLGRVANEITDTMLGADPASVDERIHRLADSYAPALGLDRRSVLAAVQSARERLAGLAEALGLKLAAQAPARAWLAPREPTLDTLAPHQLAATVAAPAAADGLTVVAGERPAGPPAAELLAAGVQDITNSMVAEGFKLNELLRMVLETMFRALDFRRVVFCLRDPKTDSLCGRFGLGADVEALKSQFRIPLQAGPASDLFSIVCAKGVDTLIADASVEKVAQRLPAWYRQAVNAPTFLLLPLATKGRTFALIYADMARPGAIEVDEKELSLLRTLRNQAVMAFRQLGG